MKRKTNKTKEEAWSQTAHAPDGEQPGPEASDTSGQSVPKSKFRKKSQQEQAAAAKFRMESQGEKLEQDADRAGLRCTPNGKFHRHGGQTQHDQTNNVQQHKTAAAVLAAHPGEFPHIAAANGAAG